MSKRQESNDRKYNTKCPQNSYRYSESHGCNHNGKYSTKAIQCGMMYNRYPRQDVCRCKVVGCKGDSVDKREDYVTKKNTTGN
mmetsp:Transcript_52197/g.62841  ORF Transcript_52197/g.62841 Transcript_52197/m.62841 type:complete len:83 (-) Transcript_52197:1196-1444(-)